MNGFRFPQEMNLDELPKEVRAAVLRARGRPVFITLPATAERFEQKLAQEGKRARITKIARAALRL